MTPAADGEKGVGGERDPTGAASAEAPRRSPIRLDRAARGEAIALVAAILLFVLMFFDWYGAKATTSAETLQLGSSPDRRRQCLGRARSDPALPDAGDRRRGRRGAPAPERLRLEARDPAGAAVCVLGLLAAVLILIRIISPPGSGRQLAGLAYESTLKLPIFLALVAALGIAYGGWRAMGQEGTTFAGVAKRLESPRRRAAEIGGRREALRPRASPDRARPT